MSHIEAKKTPDLVLAYENAKKKLEDHVRDLARAEDALERLQRDHASYHKAFTDADRALQDHLQSERDRFDAPAPRG